MGLEEKIEKLDFEGIIIGSIITAMAFVVGLFWRDAIKETIEYFLPEGQGLIYKYLIALLATIIVVIMAYILIRFQRIEIKKVVKEKVHKKGIIKKLR